MREAAAVGVGRDGTGATETVVVESTGPATRAGMAARAASTAVSAEAGSAEETAAESAESAAATAATATTAVAEARAATAGGTEEARAVEGWVVGTVATEAMRAVA
jgi:hypothetical protein